MAQMNRLNVLAQHLRGQPAALPQWSNNWTTVASGDSLTIKDNRTGKTIEVAITDNTIQLGVLTKQMGLKSYDPGYTTTTCCVSKISFIDGGAGILRYRGYPIEELAGKASFEEVTFLLLYGELPSTPQLGQWKHGIMSHAQVGMHEDMQKFLASFQRGAHPMGILTASMAVLGTMFPEANPALSGQEVYKSQLVRTKQIMRVLGAAPVIAASILRHSQGKAPIAPNPDLGYVANFLHMLDAGHEGANYKNHPVLAQVLDTLFVLHAEHELNCSTSAVRHLTSSNVDVFTAMGGGCGALYGPLHGGANEAVLRMLEEIGTVDKVPEFMEKVKARKAKLMGFGHRVYTSYDPRAKIVKQLSDKVFAITGREPLIDVAMALEKTALADDYFKSRNLYPNVDFYSGLIYRAMGFPTDFFVLLFAVPRMAGWLSHWMEWIDDKDKKIYRPFQVYKGYGERSYPAVKKDLIDPAMFAVAHPPASRRRFAAQGVTVAYSASVTEAGSC